MCVEKKQRKWKTKLLMRVLICHFPFAVVVMHAAFRIFAGRGLQCLQLQAFGAWLFAALQSTDSPETMDLFLFAPLSSCSLTVIANALYRGNILRRK